MIVCNTVRSHNAQKNGTGMNITKTLSRAFMSLRKVICNKADDAQRNTRYKF